MKRILSRLSKDPIGMLSIGFLILVLLLGAASSVLPLPDPAAIDVAHKLETPSALHWLGTDHLGRDMLSRLIHAIPTTVYTALVTVFATTLIGALWGAAAGVAGGRTDGVMMRICDVMMSFPSEVLILAVVGMMGPGLGNVVLACVVAKWSWYARMMRTLVRKEMQRGSVRFARVAGASPARILATHVVSGVSGEYAVLMTLDTAAVILMISALSFLGLGVQPPAAEWGMMLAEAKNELSLHPWQMLPAGFAIILVVAAFNFTGDAIRDAMDARHDPEGVNA